MNNAICCYFFFHIFFGWALDHGDYSQPNNFLFKKCMWSILLVQIEFSLWQRLLSHGPWVVGWSHPKSGLPWDSMGHYPPNPLSANKSLKSFFLLFLKTIKLTTSRPRGTSEVIACSSTFVKMLQLTSSFNASNAWYPCQGEDIKLAKGLKWSRVLWSGPLDPVIKKLVLP